MDQTSSFSSSFSSAASSTQKPQRYLDVMTTRPSHGKSILASHSHSSLLVEPVIIPNLSHVNIDHVNEAKQSCLFYPTGEKNTNLLKEVEQTVLKHNKLLQESHDAKNKKIKNKYRITKEDPYANVKGSPLYYVKKQDSEASNVISNIRNMNSKISSTTSLRL